MSTSTRLGWIGVVALAFPLFVGAVPKIVCEEPVVDFGRLSSEESGEGTFIIRNDGDVPLEIKDTKTTCGCTVAKLEKKVLEPGESTTLTARVNLKGRKGRQAKGIYVKSNDPVKPSLSLTIKGEVFNEIDVSPQRLYLGSVAKGEVVERPITVTSGIGPFEITKIESASDQFTITPEVLDDGKKHVLKVTLKEDARIGRVNETITIHTTIKENHQAKVTVAGYIVGQLGVEPEKIVLLDNGQRPVTRYISVKPGKIKEFNITEVIAPNDSIKVKQFKAGTTYRIQLNNVVASEALNGQKVVIKTDAPDLPLIEVPFEYKKL